MLFSSRKSGRAVVLQRRSSFYTAVFSLAFVGLTGCVSSKAPQGWLPMANEAVRSTYGGWIELQVAHDQEAGPSQPSRSHSNIMGELIALDGDSLLIFTEQGLRTVRLLDVDEARLFFFDPMLAGPQIWVTFGFLSTVSHGFGLIISAPVWLIFGSALVGARSHEPLVQFKPRRDNVETERSWREIAMYARFPQGPPRGFVRSHRRIE